jgi:hypothetical protein
MGRRAPAVRQGCCWRRRSGGDDNGERESARSDMERPCMGRCLERLPVKDSQKKKTTDQSGSEKQYRLKESPPQKRTTQICTYHHPCTRKKNRKIQNFVKNEVCSPLI